MDLESYLSLKGLENLISSLLNSFILSVLILLIGFILGRILGKFIQRLLHELGLDNALQKQFKITAEETLGHVASFAVYAMSILLILNQFGLDKIVINLLAGAVVFILLISALLGIRDFMPNLLAGIYNHYSRHLKVGDAVRIQGIEGKITAINAFEVRLETSKGDVLYIPNATVLRQELLKKSRKSEVGGSK